MVVSLISLYDTKREDKKMLLGQETLRVNFLYNLVGFKYPQCGIPLV